MCDERLLEVKATAECLSIGRTMLYQFASKNVIPSIRIKSRRLFDVKDLDEFVDILNEEQQRKPQ